MSARALQRLLAPRSVALIGGACYSIYLVHIQLLQTMTLKASKLAPNLSFGASLGAIAWNTQNPSQ